MHSNWVEALIAARTRKEELDATKRRLAALASDVELLEKKRRECAARLAREEQDVTKLEGLSWSGMLSSLLGSKERRLREEKRDVVRAQLELEETAGELERTLADRKKLLDRLAALDDAEQDYAHALAHAEREAIDAGGLRAEELRAIAEHTGELTGLKRELDEAIEAGEFALDGLELVSSSLETALSWGTFDVLGGGLVATAVKHGKLDEAKRHLVDAQHDLRLFERELSDVAEEALFDVELDNFTKFADHFLDNLLTDWVVQDKIRRSAAGIEEVTSEVEGLLGELARRRDRVVQEQADAHARKQQLLEGL